MVFLPRRRRPPPVPLLLVLAFAACHGAASGDSYDSSICLRPNYTCGNVNISYPFYLSTKTQTLEGYQDSYCGYPGLAISCEDDKPILKLNGGGENYTVKAINGTDFTVSLVDSNVLEDSQRCPEINNDDTVTFLQALSNSWLNLPPTVDYLFLLFDCTPPRPIELFQFQLICQTSSGEEPPFLVRKSYIPGQNWSEVCRGVVQVPVFKDSILEPVQLNSSWGEVLRQGFKLAWEQSMKGKKSAQCNLCETSSGNCGYNNTGQFVGCLCFDGRVHDEDCSNSQSGRSRSHTGVIAGVSVAGGLALLAAGVFFVIMRKRKQKNVINSSSKLLKYSGSGGTPRSRVGDMESGSIEDPPTHLFSYEELEEATNCFDKSRELGDGGFGTVYKGYLKDGRVVAVKRLYNSYRRLEQFHNEAAILSTLRHPSLVMFYGCTSSQSRELLLVYEFVANGTVADHLHGDRAPERALSWPLRLSIAVESAAALTYLHAIEPPVVHRDVKTTNILLDADFHVKVADFGLSRLFPLDVTHVSTAPQGTPGYVDPEYHQCYQLTDKSDVYSFGVVLVELISSKPAVDITRHRNEINLAGMAISKIQKSQIEQLVDLDLGYEADPATKKMMTMVAELAFRCLQQNGEMRPPMKEVLEVLRGIQGELRVEKDGDKHKDGPFSPTTVHAPWDSRATTPNTSRD